MSAHRLACLLCDEAVNVGHGSADELITEADLNGLDTPTVITSSYVTVEGDEKIERTVTPGALDNYFFFKIERDNSRSIYVDQDGDTRTYAQTGQYRLMFWD